MQQQARYEQRRNAVWEYTLIDGEFYEPLDRYQPKDELTSLVEPLLPIDWRIVQSGVWQQVRPPSPEYRLQGWKIHISATLSNYEDILQAVTSICVRQKVSFKFSCDRRMFLLMNSRLWSRGGSGKYMTIYPRSEKEFKLLLQELYKDIKNFEGPYILSDKRYKACKVLYYRYGAIASMNRFNFEGNRTPCIIAPDGNQISDIRTPYFNPPDWVRDPFPIEGEDGDSILKDGKYAITRSLAFSNAGGVYVGYDVDTGLEILIKEARPHVDFDPLGNDAFKYRKKEWYLLNKLKETGLTPKPIDLFRDWEHLFLVQEFLDSMIPLRSYPSTRGPVVTIDPTIQEIEEYFTSVIEIGKQIVENLQELHEYGIIFGDFSSNNILINPETLKIKFIDLEGAYELGSDDTTLLMTPGFFPADRRNRQFLDFVDDYYSLGAILYGLICPVVLLSELKPEAPAMYLKEFERDFGLPSELADTILSLMDNIEQRRPRLDVVAKKLVDAKSNLKPRTPPPTEISNSELQNTLAGISKYILDNLTPDRNDRLVPANYDANNPLNVANGALGVAYALKQINGDIPRDIVDWVLKHYALPEAYPPGLYAGLSGIAWTLAELGYEGEALDIYRDIEGHPLLFEGMDLYYGLSGFGLTSLYFWQLTREDRFIDWGIRVAESLDKNKQERESEEGYYWPSPTDDIEYIGYARGSSGISIFLLYLYLATEEMRFLELGRRALQHDLNFATEIQNGISFPEDNQSSILFPYWYNGSAGVGTTLLRYMVTNREDRYGDLFEKLVADTRRKYTVWPGLFNGITGLGNFLLDCYQMTGNKRYLEDIYRATKGILLFQLDRPSGVAFPGDSLRRISTDFGTGSAGIALFLNRIIHQKPNFNFTLDTLIPLDL